MDTSKPEPKKNKQKEPKSKSDEELNQQEESKPKRKRKTADKKIRQRCETAESRKKKRSHHKVRSNRLHRNVSDIVIINESLVYKEQKINSNSCKTNFFSHVKPKGNDQKSSDKVAKRSR